MAKFASHTYCCSSSSWTTTAAHVNFCPGGYQRSHYSFVTIPCSSQKVVCWHGSMSQKEFTNGRVSLSYCNTQGCSPFGILVIDFATVSHQKATNLYVPVFCCHQQRRTSISLIPCMNACTLHKRSSHSLKISCHTRAEQFGIHRIDKSSLHRWAPTIGLVDVSEHCEHCSLVRADSYRAATLLVKFTLFYFLKITSPIMQHYLIHENLK